MLTSWSLTVHQRLQKGLFFLLLLQFQKVSPILLSFFAINMEECRLRLGQWRADPDENLINHFTNFCADIFEFVRLPKTPNSKQYQMGSPPRQTAKKVLLFSRCQSPFSPSKSQWHFPALKFERYHYWCLTMYYVNWHVNYQRVKTQKCFGTHRLVAREREREEEAF